MHINEMHRFMVQAFLDPPLCSSTVQWEANYSAFKFLHSSSLFQTCLDGQYVCYCLSACLPVCLSDWLHVCLSTCLPICLSSCLPVCLSDLPSHEEYTDRLPNHLWFMLNVIYNIPLFLVLYIFILPEVRKQPKCFSVLHFDKSYVLLLSLFF